MYMLDSAIENVEDVYCELRQHFFKHDFCLGGNWEYKYGFLDRHLDPERKVWLRIPFQVTDGELDGECDRCDALVKIGKPFVFGHIYNEGLDQDAKTPSMGGLLNQFQEPLEKDAKVQSKWIELAQGLMQQVEQELLSASNTGFVH